MGTAPAIRFRRNRTYPLLEKIVRGLYFHHTGCLLARDTEFRWLINEHEFADSRRLGYFAVATPALCYGDVFGSRYTLGAEHGVDGAVWWPELLRVDDVHLRHARCPRDSGTSFELEAIHRKVYGAIARDQRS